jgi:hypothetical protein
MKKVWAKDFSFVGGILKRRGTAFLILSGDKSAKQKIPFAMYLAWRDGTWLEAGNTNWLCAGISYAEGSSDQLVAVGEFGEVYVRGGGKNETETIGSASNSPRERGPLRGVRRIDGKTFAVGMDRQAYVRVKAGSWAEIDHGTRPKKRSKSVVGFESIDGFNASDIYAVGWDGEIWQYDGKQWKACDSPVNQILVDVCCAGDGNVYACGRNGLMVAGEGTTWEVIADSGVEDDLWSMAWYRDRLFVATYSDLYTLDDGRLRLIDTGDEEIDTAYKLTVADDTLWSIGAKDILAYDGKKWTRIE